MRQVLEEILTEIVYSESGSGEDSADNERRRE